MGLLTQGEVGEVVGSRGEAAKLTLLPLVRYSAPVPATQQTRALIDAALHRSQNLCVSKGMCHGAGQSGSGQIHVLTAAQYGARGIGAIIACPPCQKFNSCRVGASGILQ